MDKFLNFLVAVACFPPGRSKDLPATILRRFKSIDAEPKFVVFYPVRRMSSQVVTDCLDRNYFPAYGTANAIVTDNAKVFRPKQVRHLCFRWGVKHITTTPYYPQASLVERANSNLKSALKIYHHQSQRTCDDDLPWLCAAFDTAKHESTNITPDLLFLGREIMSHFEVQWDLSLNDEGAGSPANWSFWARAYHNLKLASNKVA